MKVSTLIKFLRGYEGNHDILITTDDGQEFSEFTIDEGMGAVVITELK